MWPAYDWDTGERMRQDAGIGDRGVHGAVQEGQRDDSEPVVARYQLSEPGDVGHKGLSFRAASCAAARSGWATP